MMKPPDHKYELIRQGITFGTIVLTLTASIIVISAWIFNSRNLETILAVISTLIAASSTIIAATSFYSENRISKKKKKK